MYGGCIHNTTAIHQLRAPHRAILTSPRRPMTIAGNHLILASHPSHHKDPRTANQAKRSTDDLPTGPAMEIDQTKEHNGNFVQLDADHEAYKRHCMQPTMSVWSIVSTQIMHTVQTDTLLHTSAAMDRQLPRRAS